ncbi:hypothetical protein SS50377_24647 [Spironucleus salmonicida]|uniref:Uncharacterized protein n=1 Tax=Spironucleus salmonicida TaxID=348837 RepID=A0A9P8LQV9_9EUKA|nr:hypothetical protein SS50377_24647 [Spironucleus salmonicida]
MVLKIVNCGKILIISVNYTFQRSQRIVILCVVTVSLDTKKVTYAIPPQNQQSLLIIGLQVSLYTIDLNWQSWCGSSLVFYQKRQEMTITCCLLIFILEYAYPECQILITKINLFCSNHSYRKQVKYFYYNICMQNSLITSQKYQKNQLHNFFNEFYHCILYAELSSPIITNLHLLKNWGLKILYIIIQYS